jgi:hypothetical protein
MTDLHDRFGDWLTDGARVELPRDAALHASACDVCLRRAAAFDALLAIDPGAAALPELGSDSRRAALAPFRLARMTSAVLAVLALSAAIGIGASGLLRDRAATGAVLSTPTPTPQGEGVLGGAGGPSSAPNSPIPSASSDPNAGESAEPSEEAEASADTEATPVPRAAVPPVVITPRPTATIAPPVGTPRPTASVGTTPAPTVAATPSPEPTPTVVPTFTPVPTATPPPPSESPPSP